MAEIVHDSHVAFHEAGGLVPSHLGDATNRLGTAMRAVFECGDCGALVVRSGIPPHARLHTDIDSLESRSIRKIGGGL